jgi:hypothetical protein
MVELHIILVRAENRFGHPQDGILDHLAQMGDTEILRTDGGGMIELVTAGR